MPEPIRGVHHITAIASDPQRNLDFYTQALGLRLVKLTVNFDDPGTYHFYFGDAAGHPGTILTFFPWENLRPGRRGAGQVGTVAFEIPQASLGYWTERLRQLNLAHGAPFERFDEQALGLQDPDGLHIELIAAAVDGAAPPAWRGSPVPAEHAIRGFRSPALLVKDIEPTADLLVNTFGLAAVQQAGSRFRFAGGGSRGGQVDVEALPAGAAGGMGAGVVHHIAWRAQDDAEQLAYRNILIEQGLDVTPVLDRQYFHSIYFREPGGILFEIATDPPGFAIDESPETLGSGLRLPPWLESRRSAIQQALSPLALPVEHSSDAP